MQKVRTNYYEVWGPEYFKFHDIARWNIRVLKEALRIRDEIAINLEASR